MNHKQKLGYMALGAGILALGIFFSSCAYKPVYEEVISYTPIYNIELKQVERPVAAKERYGKQKVTRVEDEGMTKYSFEDEMVRIIWLPADSQLSFILTNKTDHSIKIVWDAAAFVDQDGMSQRVMHAGVKYADRNNSQPPTVVIRKGTVTDLIVPSDNIYYSAIYNRWEQDSLLPDVKAPDAEELRLKAGKSIGKTIQVLLPLQIEDIVNEYIFIFEVQSVEAKLNQEKYIKEWRWQTP